MGWVNDLPFLGPRLRLLGYISTNLPLSNDLTPIKRFSLRFDDFFPLLLWICSFYSEVNQKFILGIDTYISANYLPLFYSRHCFWCDRCVKSAVHQKKSKLVKTLRTNGHVPKKLPFLQFFDDQVIARRVNTVMILPPLCYSVFRQNRYCFVVRQLNGLVLILIIFHQLNDFLRKSVTVLFEIYGTRTRVYDWKALMGNCDCGMVLYGTLRETKNIRLLFSTVLFVNAVTHTTLTFYAPEKNGLIRGIKCLV